ncbi:hypothetical protein EV121DRAFT_274745 [Schizophyllum commune]
MTTLRYFHTTSGFCMPQRASLAKLVQLLTSSAIAALSNSCTLTYAMGSPGCAGPCSQSSPVAAMHTVFETPREMPVMLKTLSSRYSSHLEALGVIEAPTDALDEPGHSLVIAEGLNQAPGVIERFSATLEPPEACAGSLR